MGFLTVSVETLGGATAFGPEEVDASLKIKSLKALFQPDRRKKLLVKETGLPLEDDDTLPSAEAHAFLLVAYVAAPEPQASAEVSLPKLGWEKNFAEAFAVGDTFGENDEYEMDELLGRGGQAQVFACSRRDGRRFAVKVFRKSVLVNKSDEKETNVEDTRGYINFRREVESHEGLHHPRIVRVVEVKETENNLFLVMELGQEDLLQRVKRLGKLKELEARYVFQQLLEGIGFMHDQGFLHRDLKLENIIVHSVAQNADGWDEISIKIGDFGLSKKVGLDVSLDSASRRCLGSLQPATPPKKAICCPAGLRVLVAPPPMLPLIRATTAVGTHDYIAPEVLSRKRRDSGGHYDKEVDYFSLGTCLYVMLTGEPPSIAVTSMVGDDDSRKREAENSLFECETYKTLSSSAQTLIGGLMRVDAILRFTLADCCASAWARAQHSDVHAPMQASERPPFAKGDRQGEDARSHVTAAGG